MDTDPNDLLSTNTFLSEPILEDVIPDQFNEEFKQYYKSELDKANVKKIQDKLDLRSINTTEDTDTYDILSTNKFLSTSDMNGQQNIQNIQNIKRIKKDIKSIISIDSRDRDKIKYPLASQFEIALGKSFYNVREVRLISIEFPNTNAVINLSNNMIYWINQQDIAKGIIDPVTDSYPIYNTSLRIGSYISSSLQSEMISKMELVKRRYDQTNHYFIITLDIDTDVVTFISLILQDADVNPISTTLGSKTLYMNYKEPHGYNTGDSIYIVNSQSVASIPSSLINDFHTITVINDKKFSFDVTVKAGETLQGGGGNIVQTGISAPFQFLFGSQSNTIAPNIGYLLENSSTPIINNIQSILNIYEFDITPYNSSDDSTYMYKSYTSDQLTLNVQFQNTTMTYTNTNTSRSNLSINNLSYQISNTFDNNFNVSSFNVDTFNRFNGITGYNYPLQFNSQINYSQTNDTNGNFNGFGSGIFGSTTIYNPSGTVGTFLTNEFPDNFTKLRSGYIQNYIASTSGSFITLNNECKNSFSDGTTPNYLSWWIKITSGPSVGEIRYITNYDSVTNTIQMSLLFPLRSPSQNDTFELSNNEDFPILKVDYGIITSANTITSDNSRVFLNDDLKQNILNYYNGWVVVKETPGVTPQYDIKTIKMYNVLDNSIELYQNFYQNPQIGTDIIHLYPKPTYEIRQQFDNDNGEISNYISIFKKEATFTLKTMDNEYTDYKFKLPDDLKENSFTGFRIEDNTYRFWWIKITSGVCTNNVRQILYYDSQNNIIQLTSPLIAIITTNDITFELYSTGELRYDNDWGYNSYKGNYDWMNYKYNIHSINNSNNDTLLLTFQMNHYYTKNDKNIILYNTTSIPSLDGNNKIINILDDTSFIINGKIENNIENLENTTDIGYMSLRNSVTMNNTISWIGDDGNGFIKIVTNEPHGFYELNVDTIYFNNITFDPPLTESTVYYVDDDYTFYIYSPGQAQNPIIYDKTSFISSRNVLILKWKNHSFNTIVSIVKNIDSTKAIVTTQFSHHFNVNDSVYITETGDPYFDNISFNIVSISTNNFTIQDKNVPPKPIYDINHVINITHGIMNLSNTFRLYNCPFMGGININNIIMKIRKIIDENTLAFELPEGRFFTTYEQTSNENLYISSFIHGLNGTQTNIGLNGFVRRCINLEGENYALICCPQLATVLNTGNVKDIFAKIILDQSPGAVVFNFLSNPKTFETVPLDKLDKLTLSILNYDGSFYLFNDLDYSLTLEITEVIDTIDNFNISSKRGISDILPNIRSSQLSLSS